MKESTKVIVTLYLMFLMAYFTLSITSPIVSKIALTFDITNSKAATSLSLMYLLFSLSSLLLGTASDFWGRRKVLLTSQCLSILGLLLCSISTSYPIFVMGICLLSFGSGSYSVVSRSFANHYFIDSKQLFKIYSTFSLLIMLGPMLANQFISFFSIINWRCLYVLMLALELLLLALTITNIEEKKDENNAVKFSFKQIILNINYCINKKIFLINAILVGLYTSIILGLFALLGPHIFINQFFYTVKEYSLVVFFTGILYIFGNCVSKVIKPRFNILGIKILFIIMFLFALGGLTEIHTQHSLLLALSFITFASGVLVPISTFGGMTVIKKNFGTAAAIYTASFSLISTLWSYWINQITSQNKIISLINLLWVIIISAVCLEVILYLAKLKNKNYLKIHGTS
ncbi:hypothetical protein CF386_08210 [Paraphotobacterium marinum]|uniref:Major facilitator superfamily (MFS) profile domain-containing protein n=1 Tax=Paraphotobacterium marinum TaxID=1755811 RepID=A0A220VFS9_9GAMM|nr:MFS transporter [Paraphotobacterium marinum]ASK79042.1 hypothetical protein CF386_08210 [Paraphotobacterium marinum]